MFMIFITKSCKRGDIKFCQKPSPFRSKTTIHAVVKQFFVKLIKSKECTKRNCRKDSPGSTWCEGCHKGCRYCRIIRIKNLQPRHVQDLFQINPVSHQERNLNVKEWQRVDRVKWNIACTRRCATWRREPYQDRSLSQDEVQKEKTILMKSEIKDHCPKFVRRDMVNSQSLKTTSNKSCREIAWPSKNFNNEKFTNWGIKSGTRRIQRRTNVWLQRQRFRMHRCNWLWRGCRT